MVNLRETILQEDCFPRTICIHMGSAERADKFFEGFWPDALAIGDPKQNLHREFKVDIGSIAQFFKSDIWKAYWANRKFGIGVPVGNTMRDPGAVLVQGNQILYQQSFAHFGEQVDVAAIKDRLEAS